MNQFEYHKKENRLFYQGQEITKKGYSEKAEPYFVLEPDQHWIKFHLRLKGVFYKKVNEDKSITYFEKKLPKRKRGIVKFSFTKKDEIRLFADYGWMKINL